MAAVDLVFVNPPLTGPPWALVFGEADAASAPSRTCDLDGTFDAPMLEAQARILSLATLDASFDSPTLEAYARPVVSAVLDAGFAPLEFDAAAIYDNRVTRYLQGAVTGQHNPAIPAEIDLSAPHGIRQSQRGGTVAPWQTAAASRKTLDAGHSTTLQNRRLADALWQLATPHQTAAQAQLQVADKRVMDARTGYNLAQSWQYLTASGMQTGIPLRNQLHGHWQPADHRQHTHGGRSGASLRRWGRQFEVARWQQGMQPLTGRSYPPVPASPKDPCYLPDPNLLFDAPWSSIPNLVFICERHSVTPPGSGDTVVVLPRRVYIVLNNASLRRVDGNLALLTTGMSLSLDSGSWTWQFSASLPAQELSKLEPGAFGDPVEVELMINGTAYRAQVESISRERVFGQSSIRVGGRGLGAVLDAPYAPVKSFTNTVDRTAQQLMGDVLTLNGVSMGWGVTWGLTDWLVPAGAFQHQGSYISALNAIAHAAGGYLQPAASTQDLIVLPSYPAAPWNWATGITADFSLPADVTTREGIEWVERARYNRVFVSGQATGVLGQVTRGGTAGDSVAQMIVDPLITHADAARQRGISILSNTGRIANVSLRLPVLPETNVIVPGKFVDYVDGATTRRGIVRSVQVDVGMPEIWQTIGVETHESL